MGARHRGAAARELGGGLRIIDRRRNAREAVAPLVEDRIGKGVAHDVPCPAVDHSGVMRRFEEIVYETAAAHRTRCRQRWFR